MLALVDCNSFYVACEQLFRPSLRGRPVVVLSNNDGCVVARSPQAKRIPIAMGTPLFEFQSRVDAGEVVALSSNYTLYGDLSHRVMTVLADVGCDQEVYSIDECFLDLRGLPNPIQALARVRQRVLREVGIPTSVGIGVTKTLAKLASDVAKHAPSGVFVMPESGSGLDGVLHRIPLGDIWGIGPNLQRTLHAWGLTTALEVARLDLARLRQRFGVVGERLGRELRGEPCLSLEGIPPAKQTVTVSRSFGQQVETLADLRAAVGVFTERAAEKVRREGQVASALSVWVSANPFDPTAPRCSGILTRACPVPTNLSMDLVRMADALVQRLWRPGGRWKKAGVLLTGLGPEVGRQQCLFDAGDQEAGIRLQAAVDRLNHRHGRQVVRSAVGMLSPRWRPLAERCSPRYTTRWEEILTIGSPSTGPG